jgi:hypothetical protein
MVVIWKRINWLGETSSSTVSGRPDSLAYMGLGVVYGVTVYKEMVAISRSGRFWVTGRLSAIAFSLP